MFKLFAELIATHLDAVDRLAATEARLLTERQTAELREQFIAVLGHDLRNPLASIAAGTKLLPKAESKEATAEILPLMQKSAARMSAMIDDVPDFARGRPGSGIALKRSPESLQPVLQQVIAELRTIYPDWQVGATFTADDPVDCDGGRIAQLFSQSARRCIDPREPGSAGSDGAAVPALLSRRRRALARPRPLLRLRNRARPWRHPRRRFVAGRNAIHLPDTDQLRRWKLSLRFTPPARPGTGRIRPLGFFKQAALNMRNAAELNAWPHDDD
jgi:hypothetical protein